MLDKQLVRAIEWWIKVLELGIVERMQWQQAKEEIVHLFCDASGSPPHLGAVACIGGDWF